MNEASRALEKIRHTELDAARRVEDARERSSQIVAEATASARRLVEEGRERGRASARHRLAEAVAGAEAEAESIRARALAEAEGLFDSVKSEIGALVDQMVEAVLTVSDETGE